MRVILCKFQSHGRISYHFISEYGGPAIENLEKNVNFNGHPGALVLYKFCMQAEKSSMRPKGC